MRRKGCSAQGCLSRDGCSTILSHTDGVAGWLYSGSDGVACGILAEVRRIFGGVWRGYGGFSVRVTAGNMASFQRGHGGEHDEFSAAIRRDFGEFSAHDLRTNGGRRPPYYAAEGGILNCRRSRLLTGAEGAILNCAAQATLLIYELPAEAAPYGRRRRLTVPLAFFSKRHGRLRPPPRNFDRAFGVFLQKARSVAPSAPQF